LSPEEDKYYTVKSVTKALQILKCFSFNCPILSLTELSRITGLNKTTVLRILRTLKKHGFVEIMPQEGKYAIGVEIYKLGSVFFYNLDIGKKSQFHLTKLANKLKKTVHLCILHGDNLLYLDKIESDEQAVRLMISKKGSLAPLHCTAVGKVLLAFQADEKKEALLNRLVLKRFTKDTITDINLLRKELEKIRKKGYALDLEEHEENVTCIGVPIRNINSDVVASISIAVLAHQVPRKVLEDTYREELLCVARNISKDIGYSNTLMEKN